MISTLMSLHPSDETLSRIFDLSDAERMRSRAGRHILVCARCRAELAELRALGDAARAIPEPELPAEIRGRIRAGEAATAVSPSRGALRAIGGDATPARRSRRRRAIVMLAAAAALAAVVLLWPTVRRSELAAADAERITLSPRYPRAGTTVLVRFVPPAGVQPADTIWLEGDLRVADGGEREWYPVGIPVVRERDDYRGTLALPQGTLTGTLRLVDVRSPLPKARTLGGVLLLTSDGPAGDRPSLDALEAATARGYGPWPVQDRLAAEFARWAPDHPMRWTLDHVRYAGGALDWLGYFSSKERRFARLAETLGRRKTVRAGELAGMAALAYQIEEPELAAAWTDRLVREYPSSPWALDSRVAQIHAMELRGAPRDSIVAQLPSLDGLLHSARGIPYDHWTTEAIVDRYGDSTTRRLWRLRAAAAGYAVRGVEFNGRREALADGELRDSADAGARRWLARLAGVGGPEAERTRAFVYGELASIALARGEYRRAISLTDSTHLDSCRWVGRDTRGLAYLGLGDSSSARPLLLPFAGGEWSGAAAAQRALGLDMTDPRVKQSADSAARAAMKCGR